MCIRDRYNLDDVGPVELATIGYGQSISLTPIQLLTAVCAIGNDGILLQPRYVKSLTDSDGKVVKMCIRDSLKGELPASLLLRKF